MWNHIFVALGIALLVWIVLVVIGVAFIMYRVATGHQRF